MKVRSAGVMNRCFSLKDNPGPWTSCGLSESVGHKMNAMNALTSMIIVYADGEHTGSCSF